MKPYTASSKKEAVLFVSATWCPHCRAAKPEMERAEAIMGKVVPVYVVDSEKNADVVKSLRVRGFPTILYRAKTGRMITYTGERTGRDIADWVCTQSGKCGGR